MLKVGSCGRGHESISTISRVLILLFLSEMNLIVALQWVVMNSNSSLSLLACLCLFLCFKSRHNPGSLLDWDKVIAKDERSFMKE